MCRADAGRACPAPAPHDDHGKCPLCWSMSLASTAVLQTPPAVPLRLQRFAPPPPMRASMPPRAPATVHFQARAPPLA
jgi:hypothetical protein